ncbi:DUF3551 domain-containing protein [Xanthobacteraceae bacterium Astr-EGSB]|uniref:DUF3551 domain-containing protein n=1 Tax=Astrobacterium formosum TaxID=3069710 RepID=UPI0027AFC236|nr:DUF3551 domain-containing protein [Xanthobacteraceae bacterium Astr-EGSB]
MRILLAAMTAFILAGAVERAAAEPYYPWCAELRDRTGSSTNCGFTSYDQCMASVSGVGGFCRENSFNRTRVSEEPPPPRYRKRSQSH